MSTNVNNSNILTCLMSLNYMQQGNLVIQHNTIINNKNYD